MPQFWEPGHPLGSEQGAQVSSSPPRPQGSCESPARRRAEARPCRGPPTPQGESTGAGRQQGPSGQAAGLGRGHTLLVLSAHPNPTSLRAREGLHVKKESQVEKTYIN